MTVTYVVSSAVWVVLGFVGGYAFGRRLPREVPVVDRPVPRRGWRQWVRRNILGVLTLLVVIAAAGLYAQQSIALSKVTHCQAAYNEAFARSIQERSDAASRERRAQQKLLTTLLGNPGDRAIGRQALDEYLASLARADAERDENPIPASSCN